MYKLCLPVRVCQCASYFWMKSWIISLALVGAIKFSGLNICEDYLGM